MDLDRQAIIDAIRDSGNNISKAARKLGVARRTLQNRMRFYGMPPHRRGRPKKSMRYSAAKKSYAVGAVAVAAVAGIVLYSRKKPTVV